MRTGTIVGYPRGRAPKGVQSDRDHAVADAGRGPSVPVSEVDRLPGRPRRLASPRDLVGAGFQQDRGASWNDSTMHAS